MTKTDKALQNNSLSNLALGSSAAAAIILPQVVTRALPQLFTKVAPLTAQTLPYCTGVCGTCGASCVGSISIIAFLAIITKFKGKQKEAHT